MAGHSQFKNIMHRKGKQDAMRSKMFSKLAREITVSAKMGLPDPNMNPRLRAAIQAARAENMPKDNIERAIKKALGGDSENYEEIRYEGYAPGGVAVVIEALTDNRNRTVSDLRHALSKAGGNMAEPGAGGWQFEHIAYFSFPSSAMNFDKAFENFSIALNCDNKNYKVLINQAILNKEMHNYLAGLKIFTCDYFGFL